MSERIVRAGKIAQWGNSAAIRLNAAVLAQAKLSLEDQVVMIARENEIIIRKQRRQVAMGELLSEFDPAQHGHTLTIEADPAVSE